MFTIRRFAFCVGVVAAIFLVEAGSVSAGWETGAKIGFDTNVSRSISGGESAEYLLAKGVRASNQSAIALGGKLLFRQRLPSDFYLGEYYAYTDSRANADTFSFKEHALGAFLGRNWTRTFYTEIGYEFSRGDSFRSVGASSSFQGGTGGFGGGEHSMFCF